MSTPTSGAIFPVSTNGVLPEGVEATNATASPTRTSTRLFPSPTNTRNADDRLGTKPDVYYLVLLGVLVALVSIAGVLWLRRYRMRRRYWTSTQLAIARGEPIPSNWWAVPTGGEEYWGHTSFSRTPPGPADRWAAVGRKRERKWVRIPTLWDADPGYAKVDEDEDEPWSAGQPLMLTSRLPGVPIEQPTIPRPPSPPPQLRTFGLRAFRREQPPTPEPAPRVKEVREVDRKLEDSEPVRVAVLVQMPGYPPRNTDDDVDGDELVGWQPGMELGLWEGHVAAEHEWCGADDALSEYGNDGYEYEGYEGYGAYEGQGGETFAPPLGAPTHPPTLGTAQASEHGGAQAVAPAQRTDAPHAHDEIPHPTWEEERSEDPRPVSAEPHTPSRDTAGGPDGGVPPK